MANTSPVGKKHRKAAKKRTQWGGASPGGTAPISHRWSPGLPGAGSGTGVTNCPGAAWPDANTSALTPRKNSKLAPRTQISTSRPRSLCLCSADLGTARSRTSPRRHRAVPLALPLPRRHAQSPGRGAGKRSLRQGRTEGVGAEGDKRKERARPAASHQPSPGDSTKMPIDGISSRTERPG